MLAYTLKEILDLVPEALPLVKEAQINQDMPLGNRDSCIATALQIKYNEHVSYKPIDVFSLDKVAAAIKAYGVQDVVSDLTDKLIKAAAERRISLGRNLKDEYLQKEAAFQGEGSGFNDPIRLAKQATSLFKEASTLGTTPSEMVTRYSGNAMLDKEAAISALASRFHATKNADFVKIASALNRLDTFNVKPETVQDICYTISEMDKEAGLSALGFDFYKEALISKEAAAFAVSVMLGNRRVPYEKIARVGRDRISQYVGEDVAKEMDRGPMHTKQSFEALPLALQKLVCQVVDNI